MKDEKKVTLEEFLAFFGRLSWIPDRAHAIAVAREKGRSCSFEGFTENGDIRYSYWDGCSCHGNDVHEDFPAGLLFNENAVAEILALQAHEKAEKEERGRKEAEEQKLKREEAERVEFERLKRKFGEQEVKP